MKNNHLVLILFLISSTLLCSCNSNNIQGTWEVSLTNNSEVGIGGIGWVLLSQQEGPISFRFMDNQIDVLNKNDTILDTYKYRIGNNNSIEITDLEFKQEGKLTFKTKNKALISFPNHSYELKRK